MQQIKMTFLKFAQKHNIDHNQIKIFDLPSDKDLKKQMWFLLVTTLNGVAKQI